MKVVAGSYRTVDCAGNLGHLHRLDEEGSPSRDADVPQTPSEKKVHATSGKAKSAALYGARRRHGDSARIVDEFIYTDVGGNAVLIKCRVEWGESDPDTGKAKKVYIPVSRVERGWIVGQDAKGDRIWPLYNLPSLRNARPDEVVYIAEGEKAARALIEHGVLATTWHSASPLDRTDWKVLERRRVVVLPDNDHAGEEKARAVTDHLSAIKGADVRVLSLPDLPAKGDAYEFVLEYRDHPTIRVKDALLWITPDLARPVGLPFPIYDVSELRNLPRREMLIDGVLGTRSMAALIGASGSGKSFFALSMALSIQTGTPWMGRPVQRGSVCWVAAEGFDEIADRVSEWERHHEKKARGMKIVDGAPSLIEEKQVKELIRSIRAACPTGADPQVIVIDTLADTLGDGDENSTKDMRSYVRGIKCLRAEFPDCTVLVIHHTGWNKERERGSSALRGAMDLMFKIAERHGAPGIMDVERVKQRYRVAFERGVFERCAGRSSCYIKPIEAISDRGKQAMLDNQGAQNVLRVLRETPGLSTRELCQRAGIGKTRWHETVRKLLEGRGLIRSGGTRRRQEWFVVDNVPVSSVSAETKADTGGD